MDLSIKQNYPVCNPRGRCGRFRTCMPCARLRQARFADLAQALLEHENATFLTRITPVISSKAEITRVKAAVQHQLGKQKAVWSIEIGTITHQLHLNLISPLASFKPIKNASQHTTPQIINLRQAAAYMLKQSQIPPADAYTGRQSGSWSNPIAALAQSKKNPLLQALALQLLVCENLQVENNGGLHEGVAISVPTSSETYRNRARANLKAFYANIASNKGSI